MAKRRDKACKQDINRILLLDSDSLEFQSFEFGILNCPSLAIGKSVSTICYVVVVIRSLSKDGDIAEGHGAPESRLLPSAWTRSERELLKSKWCKESVVL